MQDISFSLVAVFLLFFTGTHSEELQSNDSTSTCKPHLQSGIPGMPGVPGIPGTPGSPGRDCFKGEKGSIGKRGSQGVIGIPGKIGPRGPEGYKGEIGEKGSAGIPGNTGSRGLKGPKGDKGSMGTKGNMGITGSIGTRGQKGSKGERGSIGTKGRSGIPGNSGPRGIKGSKGDKGSMGTTGNTGIPGNIGPRGQKGFKGERGSIGTKGSKGIPGNIGSRGLKGYKGVKGDAANMDPRQRANWKQCAWRRVDVIDNGKIQECSFNKLHDNTALKVSYQGNAQVYSNGKCNRWYFKFNGNECSGPLPIESVVYNSWRGEVANNYRNHFFEGYCENLARGTISVELWVGKCSGYSLGDAFTGWNSVSRIMIEEVPPSQ